MIIRGWSLARFNFTIYSNERRTPVCLIIIEISDYCRNSKWVLFLVDAKRENRGPSICAQAGYLRAAFLLHKALYQDSPSPCELKVTFQSCFGFWKIFRHKVWKYIPNIFIIDPITIIFTIFMGLYCRTTSDTTII